jgi:hypothetical protein
MVLAVKPIHVYAETNPYILLDSDKGVSDVINDINNFSKQYGIQFMRTARGQRNKVFINKVGYLKLSTLDKKDIMSYTLGSISKSSMAGRDKSRLYNFVEEQDEGVASAVRQLSTDVTTDVATAESIIRPFTSPFSTVLGLGCILIFVMLTAAITLDIMFLTIPMFQAFAIRGDNQRPSYISQEAWDALLVAESNMGTGRATVWSTYLKSRTKTMVIVGLTLGYLLAGKIFDFSITIVNFFESIFS